MKIILLKSYDKLGKVGDVVNVKAGFARNYLIPNQIGSPATKQNIKSLESFLRSQEIKEAKNRTNLEALSKKLNSLTIKFEMQAGEDDKLFGSITAQMIADELAEQGFNIDKKEINIADPVKTLGNHKININLGYELETKIKIKVSSAKE
tara:strand:+ start:63 stop:512 length:450 start_codon:yes stop_codon:yes gene_type:complete